MLAKELLLASGSGGTGRRLFRDVSNKATCITYTQPVLLQGKYVEKKRVLIVPDSPYRTSSVLGLQGIYSNSAGKESHMWGLASSIPDGGITKGPLPVVADADIRIYTDDYNKDSREQCDGLLSDYGAYASLKVTGKTEPYPDASVNVIGSPAISWCRSVNITGYGAGYFDLPNVRELAIIWAEQEKIDAMDPYASIQKDKTIASFLFPASTQKMAWTCIMPPITFDWLYSTLLAGIVLTNMGLFMTQYMPAELNAFVIPCRSIDA